MDHLRRAFVGLYRRAKLRWNRCGSFDNMQVLIFYDLGLKTPLCAPKISGFGGDLTPKWGALSSRLPKGTSLRGNTSRFVSILATFCVSRGTTRNVYLSRASVCLCVCLSLAAFPDYCTDPDVTWKNGSGCRLVVQYWAALQSVHGFRCHDNIAPNAKCQRALCTRYMPGQVY